MLKSELMDLLYRLGDDDYDTALIYIKVSEKSLLKIKKVSVDEDGDIILET